MFTGIIAAVGRVTEVSPTQGGIKLSIDAASLGLDDVAIGDSIAVNGVCLTVVSLRNQVPGRRIPETMSCVAGFECDGQVNLEKALRHVRPAVAAISSAGTSTASASSSASKRSATTGCWSRAAAGALQYVACKGSIAVDGVSASP